MLESHELVLPCFQAMERDPNRIFVIRMTNLMFDMFKHPKVSSQRRQGHRKTDLVSRFHTLNIGSSFLAVGTITIMILY